MREGYKEYTYKPVENILIYSVFKIEYKVLIVFYIDKFIKRNRDIIKNLNEKFPDFYFIIK